MQVGMLTNGEPLISHNKPNFLRLDAAVDSCSHRNFIKTQFKNLVYKQKKNPSTTSFLIEVGFYI